MHKIPINIAYNIADPFIPYCPMTRLEYMYANIATTAYPHTKEF